MSSGSKPVTTIGTRYFSAIGRYSSMPMMVQTCPAARKPCTRLAGELEHGAHGRRHQHVRNQHREVLQAQLRRLHDRHRVGRGGGLEADGEEHDLPLGFFAGQGHGVHRRVDDPHVAPFRLDREQVLLRAGHAQHVAERAEDHLRPGGDGHGPVDHLDRRDAHRAARAVDQRDFPRQHLVEREANDGMRLPAADFHDVPRPRGGGADGGGQSSDGFGVAVFVDVLHRDQGSGVRDQGSRS